MYNIESTNIYNASGLQQLALKLFTGILVYLVSRNRSEIGTVLIRE